jgi:16S rRNA (cytidine1402-2'-O)-methyltransferase
MGKLFICGTPIGNLEDVTIRLLKVLRGVQVIACEDTRRALKLLNRYHIRKPLLSYHAFSKPEREAAILRRLDQGDDVAYVSDAGMPMICDPGQRLVQQAVAGGYPVEVIPGPSAGITALAVSGLPADTFVFLGFPPDRGGKRRDFFRAAAEERRTLVLYEAPHRLSRTLADLRDALGGGRFVAVARELTKRHEEVRRGTVAELCAYYADQTPRGECCLVIGPQEELIPEWSPDTVKRELSALLEQGWTKQAALKHKAAQYHVTKSELYKLLLELDAD